VSPDKSGFLDTIHLPFAEYFADQKLSLSRAARRSSFAAERAAIRLLEEIETFREALRSEAEEEHGLHYRAQQAVALARAVQATLEAEKGLAVRQMEEAKLLLKAAQDRVEEVQGKLGNAANQLATLLHAMRSQNLSEDWVNGPDLYKFKPQARYQEWWSYPGALENESGTSSDENSLESFYDPDSENDVED
jgi:hypothetical protein